MMSAHFSTILICAQIMTLFALLSLVVLRQALMERPMEGVIPISGGTIMIAPSDSQGVALELARRLAGIV